MKASSGLINIKFKKDAPFWTVVAYKKRKKKICVE